MSRTPLIAGNWKMHKTVAEAEAFVALLLPELSSLADVEAAVCPSFLALAAVAAVEREDAIFQGEPGELGIERLLIEQLDAQPVVARVDFGRLGIGRGGGLHVEAAPCGAWERRPNRERAKSRQPGA